MTGETKYNGGTHFLSYLAENNIIENDEIFDNCVTGKLLKDEFGIKKYSYVYILMNTPFLNQLIINYADEDKVEAYQTLNEYNEDNGLEWSDELWWTQEFTKRKVVNFEIKYTVQNE
jgi:hypothetical protein